MPKKWFGMLYFISSVSKATFSMERAGVAAMALGIVDRCMELSIAYANELVLAESYRALNVLSPTYEPRATGHIPARIAALYEGLESDAETRDLVTAHVAAELCQRLAEQGVDHFHFYTMNRAGLSLSTCRLLGIKPQPEAKQARAS